MERARRLTRPFLAGLALVAAGAGIRRYRANRESGGRRSTMLEENKAISRRLVEEVFNAGRLDAADELVSPGYVGYDPANPGPTMGTEGVKQQIAGYRAAFPDVKITVEDQIAERERVVTRWSASGTHEGELFGIAPTGRQATVSGITIDRIVDGHIVESWNNWDTLGLLQQLGAVPEPMRA